MKRNRVRRSTKVDGSPGGKKEEGCRIRVLITQDDEKTFSAVALNLPGVGSCGENEKEAIENFKEAAQGALDSYAAAGEPVPWKETPAEKIPAGSRQTWVVVHA